MNRKLIGITLLLLLVTGLLGRQLYVSVLQFKTENNLSKIQPKKDLKQAMGQDKTAPRPQPAAVKIYNQAEFAIIPEKNIFSESRAREEKTDATAVPETPPLAQKPILVGVTISDKQQLASIIDPVGASQSQNRRAQTKKIGDMYQGYTITQITLDHIVLESGTRREIIPLHEGSKRPQGGKTPILSTRVVSIGPGGTSGGMQATIVQPAGPATARTGAVPAAMATAATPTGQPSAGRAAPGAQTRPAQAAGTAQQPAQAPQPQAPAQQDSQGRRIIRTPFGDIVRPNP